jgi:hypothetical protein
LDGGSTATEEGGLGQAGKVAARDRGIREHRTWILLGPLLLTFDGDVLDDGCAHVRASPMRWPA